jgi:hypothetical protein
MPSDTHTSERYYCEFDPCILDVIEKSLERLVERVLKLVEEKDAIKATFEEVQYIVGIYREYAAEQNRVSPFAFHSSLPFFQSRHVEIRFADQRAASGSLQDFSRRCSHDATNSR